jgi:hypothetical protein
VEFGFSGVLGAWYLRSAMAGAFGICSNTRSIGFMICGSRRQQQHEKNQD